MLRLAATQAALVWLIALVVAQGLAALLHPAGYAGFVPVLPLIPSQVAFWGPIVALIAGGFIFRVRGHAERRLLFLRLSTLL
jgi:hypothetical protein